MVLGRGGVSSGSQEALMRIWGSSAGWVLADVLLLVMLRRAARGLGYPGERSSGGGGFPAGRDLES